MNHERLRSAGWGDHTVAAHCGAGQARNVTAGAPPIYQSSVFTFDDLDQVDAVFDGRTAGYSYSRVANPNLDQLASAVSELEGAPAAMASASGMAAVHAGLRACLGPSRRRIVAADDIYGGTYQLFEEILRPEGIEVTYVPSDDLPAIGRAAGDDCAALYFETISNPMMRVADLAAIGQIARSRGVPLMVDNTFASPYVCCPLAAGAALVVHSATKYLAGHHDAIAGVLAGDAELVGRAARYNMITGATLDPFCAWLVWRGIRTLGLRMQRSCDNAMALAQHLLSHPQVRAVHYPGLPESRDHGVAARLLRRGFGAMLSFDLGDLAAARNFVRGLRLIQFAPSLGGYDTTISHPVLTSHRGVPPTTRQAMGITDGLIRMSVGAEDAADLIADLDQALAPLDD